MAYISQHILRNIFLYYVCLKTTWGYLYPSNARMCGPHNWSARK